MIDRSTAQQEFQRYIEPTLREVSYQARLWTTATQLNDGAPATFATNPRILHNEFVEREAPPPDAIPQLIEQTSQLLASTEAKVTNPRQVAELAGTAYVLTALIQPFPDMNKQVARLVSLSYLHQSDPDSRPYHFPLPKEDGATTTQFHSILDTKLFLTHLPATNTINDVLTNTQLSPPQQNVLREILTNDTSLDFKYPNFNSLDILLTTLGGDATDTTGTSFSRGQKIYHDALQRLLTLQTRSFLHKVLTSESDSPSPESRLLDTFVDKYINALPATLVYNEPAQS